MTRIQMRRDTSTNWSVNNPTPANGEPCYETDTHKFKIGDGVTKYTNLPYQGDRSSGGGATIDDSTTSTTSTWSSSKINSEITTDIENLKNTKNDNIFDIGKFTVVGSPTITDDGIASGFSASNYVKVPFATTKPFVIEHTFNTGSFDSSVGTLNALQLQNVANIYINKGQSSFTLSYNANDGTTKYKYMSSISVNTNYKIICNINGANSYFELKNLDTNESVKLNVPLLTENSALTGIFIKNLYAGSIDLKQFSITVDGKEVFNGLMESTKPIYDAIKANNMELSEFKTETSTNFSAVSSALNEKANLTDLALKQNMLVSGTNIKTINGETILGEGDITVGGSTSTNMVTTDTAQDITANKTFYGEIRVGADNNYATLAKFSKEALASGDSTLLEHIDLGEADFVVQGNLGKKVYETDKYVYKKYINVDDLSDNQIAMDNSISSQVAHMAMPSDKYIDLTLGASGTTYTAPADGWFCFSGKDGTASGSVDFVMRNQTRYFTVAGTKSSTTSAAWGGWILPAKKGDNVVYFYSGSISLDSTNWVLRFYYTAGSEPVA